MRACDMFLFPFPYLRKERDTERVCIYNFYVLSPLPYKACSFDESGRLTLFDISCPVNHDGHVRTTQVSK